MPQVKFLKTTHYSTVGAMKAGQVVNLDPDEAQRVLDKFGHDVQLVEAEKTKEPAANKVKAPGKNK